MPQSINPSLCVCVGDHVSHLEKVGEEELDRLLGIVVDVENLFMCVHKVQLCVHMCAKVLLCVNIVCTLGSVVYITMCVHEVLVCVHEEQLCVH